MRTFKRVCITDYQITAENGDHFEVKRGKEYITSAEKNGRVTVFSNFWEKVPVSHFAGELVFTKE